MECCVRDRDFSQKKVYRCELCERWFCERHIEPRLAFIKDLKAIEHSPEVRALYYTEMQYENGHPCFEYSRRKFRQLDIEEKKRNELIKQALDRMNHYYDALIPEKTLDVEADRKKRVEMLLREEAQPEGRKITIIDEGELHYNKIETAVPEEVFADKEYRKRIEKAKTLKELQGILFDYYKQHKR